MNPFLFINVFIIEDKKKIYKNNFIKRNMKKVISIISFIFAINLASAFELGDLLGSIEQSLVILIALFLITFSLAFFSLSKVFKDNRAMAGVIAGILAFIVVYGVNKMGVDVGGFFGNLGISESAISLALFVIITAGIVYMFVKLKKDTLLILGALLIGLSFFVYAKVLLIVVGAILIAVRFFIPKEKWNRSRKGFQNAGAGI
jgi:hypothetical protein